MKPLNNIKKYMKIFVFDKQNSEINRNWQTLLSITEEIPIYESFSYTSVSNIQPNDFVIIHRNDFTHKKYFLKEANDWIEGFNGYILCISGNRQNLSEIKKNIYHRSFPVKKPEDSIFSECFKRFILELKLALQEQRDPDWSLIEPSYPESLLATYLLDVAISVQTDSSYLTTIKHLSEEFQQKHEKNAKHEFLDFGGDEKDWSDATKKVTATKKIFDEVAKFIVA